MSTLSWRPTDPSPSDSHQQNVWNGAPTTISGRNPWFCVAMVLLGIIVGYAVALLTR